MDGTSGNILLNSLTPGALRAFNAHEEQHDITHVLITSDETPEFIFFPGTDSVVSIIRSTEDGWTVEAGVIGNEGLLNLQTVIATPAPTGNQAVVQASGRFVRTDARLVRNHFHENAPFRDRVLSFTNTFLGQVTQNLVCNRLHAIEQRLAKWILLMRDRTDTDDLHLTHDFLSHMLGIHRPGVSIAVTALEVDGLIRHARNLITIRDHEGLVERSCECYGVLHGSLLNFRAAFAV